MTWIDNLTKSLYTATISAMYLLLSSSEPATFIKCCAWCSHG